MTPVEVLTKLRALAARNITFFLDGNRLRYKPWNAVTEAERAFIRANREQLKMIVRQGLPACLEEIRAAEPKVETTARPETQTIRVLETLW